MTTQAFRWLTFAGRLLTIAALGVMGVLTGGLGFYMTAGIIAGKEWDDDEDEEE